ncbi:MAG: GNAT family N-acetyltransferase [Eubacterium sp.]|nr:GNAT family N-acetyltransferase [Eubacterium sp.]MCM1304538.1 GNAT family N-acetyltransferase [Butyrivibrio sp.]MCM1344183.1 GNAT family N-acetyltransferase [Muribaculaceae bacterium]MCM1409624.1 GNAT family N-acetyltransferase [Lachnospiraceae bacterium]
MEKFCFEIPSIDRKEDAIAFINEYYEFKSEISGSGGLHKFLDDYEGWLDKLQRDQARTVSEKRVPSKTYFLVRKNDNKIIGMTNIRLVLNETLKKRGGHIGYSIRPTERGKGYNKINLYSGLKVCQEHNIPKVLMDADQSNPASWKTMEALGGIKTREYLDEENARNIVKAYAIDVNKSLRDYSAIYEPMLEQ